MKGTGMCNAPDHACDDLIKNGIQWTCPHCGYNGEHNTDYYHLTAVPMCGNCSKEVEWDEILTPGAFVVCRGCEGTGLSSDEREFCMDCDGARCIQW